MPADSYSTPSSHPSAPLPNHAPPPPLLPHHILIPLQVMLTQMHQFQFTLSNIETHLPPIRSFNQSPDPSATYFYPPNCRPFHKSWYANYNIALLNPSCRSSIKIKNNISPNTEPCGTPLNTAGHRSAPCTIPTSNPLISPSAFYLSVIP